MTQMTPEYREAVKEALVDLTLAREILKKYATSAGDNLTGVYHLMTPEEQRFVDHLAAEDED